MKKLALVLAVGAAALFGGSAASAADNSVKEKAATDVSQQSTDISSRHRHRHFGHRHHYRHYGYRYHRPYYRSYGYAPRPYYGGYGYAPRPYYGGYNRGYGYGGPAITFGFGGRGW